MGVQLAQGDRVVVRDRTWRVRRATALASSQVVVEIDALDNEVPQSTSIVTPPEEVERLPPQDLTLEQRDFDSFYSWSANLRVLLGSLRRPSDSIVGARFGRVAPEAYQILPVVRALAKPRPSLLVADDVGLGKTVEAGLIMLELLARERARRILVVAPPGLLRQWHGELLEKFGLQFVLLENATGVARELAQLPAGASPWDVLPRVITSIDFMKKETIRRRALRKRWDLVIVDEAHSLAESGTPASPYRTQRTRLGEALRDGTRGLVLLTATPHNGHRHSFRSLIELVEPSAASLFGGRDDLKRRVQSAMVRRLKSQIVRTDVEGRRTAVFPARHVEPMKVELGTAERELLKQVASYCSKTARAAEGSDDVDLVTFAMQIVKKRALSSRRALTKTIESRLEALRKEQVRESAPSPSELRDLQADLPFSDATSERIARKVLRSSVPTDEKRRKAETKALNAIQKRLRELPSVDAKVTALVNDVQRVVGELGEKVIVFTEYVDTLESLAAAIEAVPALAGRWAVLRGGMSARQRERVQAEFEGARVSILLATDAASEGLNLQHSCRRIYHVELPWNPNRLEQRNGRVDRYGQTREPILRFLYFPDSPEDDVMAALVRKIDEMHKDQVATPDILGVLSGIPEIQADLTRLDPDDADLEQRKQRILQSFDERARLFRDDLQPLLLADPGSLEELSRFARLFDEASPILPDQDALGELMRTLLGSSGLRELGEGLVRIDVPPSLRGPQVQAEYPHVTSRDTTASGTLAEAGIPPGRVRKVIMTTRTYPIRVGNPHGGSSGWMSQPLSWAEISRRSGLDVNGLRKSERTSTTKRKRRVAEFDWALLRRSSMLNNPTDIALTFVDYIDKQNQEARRFDQLTRETVQFIEEVERVAEASVSLISTRFDPRCIIDRRNW